MKGLTERQSYWLKHIKASTSQGLSLRAYALANGLGVSTIYAWRKRLESLNVPNNVQPNEQNIACASSDPVPSPADFVAVQLAATTHPARHNAVSDCRIELPNGITVHWPLLTAAEPLRLLLPIMAQIAP